MSKLYFFSFCSTYLWAATRTRFALGILAFYTLQYGNTSSSPQDDVELAAKKEGVDLDQFLQDPESRTASKILVHSLIKEHLRVVGKLQKYEAGANANAIPSPTGSEEQDRGAAARIESVAIDMIEEGDPVAESEVSGAMMEAQGNWPLFWESRLINIGFSFYFVCFSTSNLHA